MRLDEMYYTEIEMEGMKEILRDKEEEIKKLKSDLSLVIKERDDNIKMVKKLSEKNGQLEEDNRRRKEKYDLLFKTYKEEYKELEEENRLLKNEIAWLKDHTKYNSITEEYYIDGTMTATEAKLRLQQAEANQNYVSKLEEENKKLKEENSYRAKVFDIIPQDEKSVAEETINDLQERIRFLEQCLDNKEKVNKSLREENKRLSDFLECES